MINLINSDGINKTVAFRILHFRILELGLFPQVNQFNCVYFYEEKASLEMVG